MTDVNIAAIHQAIADAVPEREAVVWRARPISWAGGGRQGATESSVVSLIDLARQAGELTDPITRREIAHRQHNALNVVRAKQEMTPDRSR